MLYQYYVKNSVHNGHLGINSTCFRSKNINFIRLEIYNQTFPKQIFLVTHEFSEMLYASIYVFSFISSKQLESSVEPNMYFTLFDLNASSPNILKWFQMDLLAH